ncbi:hypothetical protein T439DRAFT_328524 [Meredithblackwellia eburnea MCA 4105]
MTELPTGNNPFDDHQRHLSLDLIWRFNAADTQPKLEQVLKRAMHLIDTPPAQRPRPVFWARQAVVAALAARRLGDPGPVPVARLCELASKSAQSQIDRMGDQTSRERIVLNAVLRVTTALKEVGEVSSGENSRLYFVPPYARADRKLCLPNARLLQS